MPQTDDIKPVEAVYGLVFAWRKSAILFPVESAAFREAEVWFIYLIFLEAGFGSV